MANEEHLAILRQGVEVWNAWQRVHLPMPPNLSKLDFTGADLTRSLFSFTTLDEADFSGGSFIESNFTGANLTKANFAGADLRNAYFTEAHLIGTNFTQADLTGAILSAATLIRANFTGAKLTGVDLSRTHLIGCDLVGATVAYAHLVLTVFTDIDLRNVHGLDSVDHRGPSSIGIDTLYRSKGEIPEVFLRGCGVPNSMIEYARSLVAAERPIDYYSVFISYSSHDEALAERLHADLQARGVRCWYAPHDLTPGSYIVRGIDEAIRLHDKVVLLLSEASIKSHWVLHEVTTAQTREAREGRMVLYPVRLDESVLTTAAGWAAELRDARHIGDFRQWEQHQEYQKVFKRLLADLTAPPATPDR